MRPPWWPDRACADTDPAVFFTRRHDRARAICAGCPAQAACLVEALLLEEAAHRHGFRGGLSPDDRDLFAKLAGNPGAQRANRVRHGTEAGYQRGCRDLCCRRGHAAYYEARRRLNPEAERVRKQAQRQRAKARAKATATLPYRGKVQVPTQGEEAL